MRISEILKSVDSDKVNGHHYAEPYDEMFEWFDRTAPLEILEIGTQKGGSLRAWKEYFPNATVTGIDIEDQVTEENRRPDINYIISDIKDFHTDKQYDIIIDDGSHYLIDVLYTVSYFARPSKLKKGGILIIEDVQNSSLWLTIMQNALPDYLGLGYFNMKKRNNQYDDFLIVIKRHET